MKYFEINLAVTVKLATVETVYYRALARTFALSTPACDFTYDLVACS